ncbi:MAG: hypothetical protein LAQ69_02885 [Acidobacteriia bacterium]|nr:hypothetical protein [Terriglobia bacterium]
MGLLLAGIGGLLAIVKAQQAGRALRHARAVLSDPGAVTASRFDSSGKLNAAC